MSNSPASPDAVEEPVQDPRHSDVSDPDATYQNFRKEYRCFSAAFVRYLKQITLDVGGQIVMPESVLQKLSDYEFLKPMIVKLTNTENGRVTHCGVFEFTAEEGCIYMPRCIMDNMGLDNGDVIDIQTVSLPEGQSVLLRPQKQDCLNIKDIKAALEDSLRYYGCLTVGDHLQVFSNGNRYIFEVAKTCPDNAVSLVDGELTVDIMPLKHQIQNPKAECGGQQGPTEKLFVPFSGIGSTTNGKTEMNDSVKPSRGIPDFSYVPDCLHFLRGNTQNTCTSGREEACNSMQEHSLIPFSGVGHTLMEFQSSATDTLKIIPAEIYDSETVDHKDVVLLGVKRKQTKDTEKKNAPKKKRKRRKST